MKLFESFPEIHDRKNTKTFLGTELYKNFLLVQRKKISILRLPRSEPKPVCFANSRLCNPIFFQRGL